MGGVGLAQVIGDYVQDAHQGYCGASRAQRVSFLDGLGQGILPIQREAC